MYQIYATRDEMGGTFIDKGGRVSPSLQGKAHTDNGAVRAVRKLLVPGKRGALDIYAEDEEGHKWMVGGPGNNELCEYPDIARGTGE